MNTAAAVILIVSCVLLVVVTVVKQIRQRPIQEQREKLQNDRDKAIIDYCKSRMEDSNNDKSGL